MVETTLISTFYSVEPFMPAALKFSPSRVILLINEDEKNAALKENVAFVKKALQSAAFVKEVTIDPYDLYDVAKKTVEIIDKENGESRHVIANVTGGRKTAMLGVVYACYARKDFVDKIVYAIEETSELIELPKLSFEMSRTKRAILEQLAKNAKPIPEIAEKLEKTRGMVYSHLRELKNAGYVDDEYKLTTAGKVALL